MSFIDPFSIERSRAVCEELAPLRKMFLSLVDQMSYAPWSETIYNGDWIVSSFKYQQTIWDTEYGLSKEQTEKDIPIIKNPWIHTMGFSVLGPGTEIEWHSGYAGDVWRLHFGLDCPEGDLALQVGDETRTWKNGEFLMFNDQERHRAWNRTDEDRVILLVDILKP